MSEYPTDYPRKGEVWQFATGNRYRIISVSNHASGDGSKSTQHQPDGRLIRGELIDGDNAVIYGPAPSWVRAAVRREAA